MQPESEREGIKICHFTAPWEITHLVLSTITAWLLQVTPSFQLLGVTPFQKAILSALFKVTSALSSTLLHWCTILHATFFKACKLFKSSLKGHTQCFDLIWPLSSVKIVWGKLHCSFILNWSYSCSPMHTMEYSFLMALFLFCVPVTTY
jgi:hypothetical protein